MSRALLHHGDLEVTGDLNVTGPLFVTGNVRVSGVMQDCGPDSRVAIAGGLHVGHLNTDGELACGDIEAPGGVVYGHYNDNTLSCGRIRAKVVIADEHEIDHNGVEAEIDFSDLNDYGMGGGDGVFDRLHSLFVDEVFTKDDEDDEDECPRLDRDKLFERLHAGKPAYR